MTCLICHSEHWAQTSGLQKSAQAKEAIEKLICFHVKPQTLYNNDVLVISIPEKPILLAGCSNNPKDTPGSTLPLVYLFFSVTRHAACCCVPGGRYLVKGFLPSGSVVRWSSVRTLHGTSGAYALELRLKEAFLIHSACYTSRRRPFLNDELQGILLTIYILHYLKDPKLWALGFSLYYGPCRLYIINRNSTTFSHYHRGKLDAFLPCHSPSPGGGPNITEVYEADSCMVRHREAM